MLNEGTRVKYKGELPNFTDEGHILDVDIEDEVFPYLVGFDDGYSIWVEESEIEEVYI